MSQTLLPSDPDWVLTHGVITRRVFAFIADCLLIGIAGWAGALGIALFGVLTLGLGWMAFHILPWLPLVYFMLFVGYVGATPGQRLFGLSVRQDADLSRPTMAQAVVWTLLLWISIGLAFVPCLLALVMPRHRAAHDLLTGLVVIRATQNTY
jgi:uncharacterized RDD family membrane protein YckC